LINIEQFLTIKKVDSDIVKSIFLDWENSICNNPNTFPETSLKIKEIEIKLSKEYNENSILKEFIDKVIEISEPETYNERVYEHKTIHNITSYIDRKRLMHRMISCGNYIAVNGRIGNANFVLVPHSYYKKLYEFINERGIGDIQIFPTNLLTDRMIFGRKNINEQSGIYLFLDEKRNKYCLKDVGNTAKHQYHILKVRCLQDERRKKLEEIESKNSTHFK